MSKTIKMVAVVDGEEKSVGRCHPGQARLLRKQGFAEWKDGKLVLSEPPGEPEEVVINIESSNPQETFDVLQAALKVRTRPLPEFGVPWERVLKRDGEPSGTWRRPLGDTVQQLAKEVLEEEMGAIDPEGLVIMWDYNGHPYSAMTPLPHGDPTAPGPHEPPTDTICGSLREFCEIIAARKALDHTLASCDDPKRRMIGFIDYNDNEVVNVGLGSIKEGLTEEAVDPLGIGLEAFKKAVGSFSKRADLFSNGQEEPHRVLTDEELSAIDDVEMWETAPRHPCNAEIGKPEYDEEGGYLRIPMHGIDSTRALRSITDLVVGRTPEKIRASYPGWKSFTWPNDADVIETFDHEGVAFPDVLATLEGGVYRRVQTEDASYLVRVFSTFRKAWLDISTMVPGDEGVRYYIDRVIDLPSEWPSLTSAMAAAERILAETVGDEPDDSDVEA